MNICVDISCSGMEGKGVINEYINSWEPLRVCYNSVSSQGSVLKYSSWKWICNEDYDIFNNLRQIVEKREYIGLNCIGDWNVIQIEDDENKFDCTNKRKSCQYIKFRQYKAVESNNNYGDCTFNENEYIEGAVALQICTKFNDTHTLKFIGDEDDKIKYKLYENPSNCVNDHIAQNIKDPDKKDDDGEVIVFQSKGCDLFNAYYYDITNKQFTFYKQLKKKRKIKFMTKSLILIIIICIVAVVFARNYQFNIKRH